MADKNIKKISDEELDILNRNSNRIILFSQTEPKTHINGEVVLVTAAGHKIYSVVKKIYTLKYLDNERSKPIATSRFRCLMEMFDEFLNATDCVNCGCRVLWLISDEFRNYLVKRGFLSEYGIEVVINSVLYKKSNI